MNASSNPTRPVRLVMMGLVSIVLLAAGSAAADGSHQAARAAAREVVPASIDVRHALAGHGDWVRVGIKGVAWRPRAAEVGAGFIPYVTGGQWDCTTSGWQFVATQAWGAVVYHYGRWFRDPTSGWVWQPGTEWRANWVDWRVGDGFVGWAPLPPAGGTVAAQAKDWVFASDTDFTHEASGLHIVTGTAGKSYYERTAPFQHAFDLETGACPLGPTVVAPDRSIGPGFGAVGEVFVRSLRPASAPSAELLPTQPTPDEPVQRLGRAAEKPTAKVQNIPLVKLPRVRTFPQRSTSPDVVPATSDLSRPAGSAHRAERPVHDVRSIPETRQPERVLPPRDVAPRPGLGGDHFNSPSGLDASRTERSRPEDPRTFVR
jgi:hypothetical protein